MKAGLIIGLIGALTLGGIYLECQREIAVSEAKSCLHTYDHDKFVEQYSKLSDWAKSEYDDLKAEQKEKEAEQAKSLAEAERAWSNK